MKKISGILIILIVSLFVSGCGSSKQFVLKPDVTKPIPETESIIKIKRASSIIGAAYKYTIIANNRVIGEIANGDELLWKTNANSLECVSVDYGVGGFSNLITLDSTPLPYKCFSTKPKEILLLNLDSFYPRARFARSIAFSPIFKQDGEKKQISSIKIDKVKSNVEIDSIDLEAVVLKALSEQFKDKLNNGSTTSIELEILDYKTGNAALRWLGGSHTGSTIAKIKVKIKQNNLIIDEFITRPVVASGGLLSVGADDYIWEDVAEDIFLYLFNPD
jgi:hypothetical protein